MSSSRMWILAVPLAALFATACTNEVTQEDSGTSLRATFDSTRGVIPTPNDLALQAAPSQTDPARRGALMQLILEGGFRTVPSTNPADLGSLSVINIPYEFVADGVGTTATGSAAIDPTTVRTTTFAIVRVTGTPPLLIDPLVVGTRNSAVQVLPDYNRNGLPDDSAWESDTRYVVAMRGGPNGVKTMDGRTLSASSPIYLIANGVNLSDPDTRPSSVTPQQAADLQKLQTALTAGLEWDPVFDVSTCSVALGAPAAAFPEGRCWLPIPTPGAVTPALTAVGLAFPVSEAVSIQTFETAP